jgi:hypothetical protein
VVNVKEIETVGGEGGGREEDKEREGGKQEETGKINSGKRK